jgi:hypothetical protein
MNKSISYYVLPGLSDTVVEPVRWFDPDKIVDIVCSYYDTDKEKIRCWKYRNKFYYKRNMLVYLLNRYSRVTYDIVSEITGYRKWSICWIMQRFPDTIKKTPGLSSELIDLKYLLAMAG